MSPALTRAPVQEDAAVCGAQVGTLADAVTAGPLGGWRAHQAPLLLVELVPARVGVGEVLDTGAATRTHAASESRATAPRRARGAGWAWVRRVASWDMRGVRGMAWVRVRGVGWIGAGVRLRCREDAGWRGTVRGSGAGRTLTGASMTLRPTGPRGPCSRSRGPTTWRPKASWRCRRLARAAAPVVGRPVPFPQGGRAEALPPRVASVHPGSVSMHPAGATEQRTCDHAARRRMVAPTRRSPPASGKRPTSSIVR